MSLPPGVAARLAVSEPAIAQLCRKWRIAEFALFGSVLTDEFRPNSDVDVLVTFKPGAGWDLWDFARLQGEAAQLFGRPVDLVVERALRNPFRRREILRTRRSVYAA